MTVYTGKTYNKSYLKEEGRSDLSSNPKNVRFDKSSLAFNRYKHFNYNKSLFESGNIPLDSLLECINKITTILDKYVNDVSPFSPKLKRLFTHDLGRERDVIAENRLKIGKELVLKFNVDRLYENSIKHKLNGTDLDLSKFNISVVPNELETDKNLLNTDSKRARSEKGRPPKQKGKSDGKKGRSGKKEDQIIDSSNLNYYIKYFNYLKLYYQYYLNHFVSVYIFYKSFSSGIRNDTKRSLVHIKDGERSVYILGKLFVYFRKLIILHLKCLINLLPISFVYNPDNFINYNGLVDYNDVIYCEMNSLGDIDSGLRLELKRDLFDCVETNKKFDLEEFNTFLKVNNLNDVALVPDRPLAADIPANAAGDHTSRVDTGDPNVAFHGGADHRIHPRDITNFATATLPPPVYPINASATPGPKKRSINLVFDPNSNFNPSSLSHENKPLSMIPSLTSAGDKPTIGPKNASTVRADFKTHNAPPTTSGATNAKDSFTPTRGDFVKDNSTSNNSHSDARRNDSGHNYGKYDSKHDGMYDAKYDPKYPDKHDDRYHDKHHIKYEDSRTDGKYGDGHSESKYDSKSHENKHDIKHYTSKHENRKYDDRRDVKHEERRYSDSNYDGRRYDDRRDGDARHNEGRHHDDSGRHSGYSRSGSSSSRYSDNRRSEKRRHSDDNSYENTIRHSYGNRRYSGDRRHDSRRDRRYSDGGYGGRRSISHSTHSSHSSSSSYHRSTTKSGSRRRPHHPGFTRSSSGSSSSAYSMNRGYASQSAQQHLPIKPELESQNPPQSSARADPPDSSSYGMDLKSVKLDNAEKERLGKELKSGKKLKSSTKFNTMNIKEIFSSISSKTQPANATTTTTAHDNHLGYKSTAPSDNAGSNHGTDAGGSDGGSRSSQVMDNSAPSSMVTDSNTGSNKGVDETGANKGADETSANKGADETGAGKHIAEGSGNNSNEIVGGKTDDPPPSSMLSYIDNINIRNTEK
ncbi:hypothetical protein MACJ_001626 [Theileria orientalis]|uniref:Uncharacterized protein n=1 Tax=Theileria orientalis TaxID=68886 RepID=A0A976M8L2_THEOR|nr:hypothetical protein MACJ_001626 [Theileria orientalis]